MTNSVRFLPLVAAASLTAIFFSSHQAFAQAVTTAAQVGPRAPGAAETGDSDSIRRIVIPGSDQNGTSTAASPTTPPGTRFPSATPPSRIVIISRSAECPLDYPETAPAKLDCVKID